MEECTCPFCDRLLVEVDEAVEPCCSEQDMGNINGMNVCINCGSVYGYVYVNEYINFHGNMYRIQRKSIYYRKYHLYNKIDFLSRKHFIQISMEDLNKIVRVFHEINKISRQINGNRKRMIDINYFFKKSCSIF